MKKWTSVKWRCKLVVVMVLLASLTLLYSKAGNEPPQDHLTPATVPSSSARSYCSKSYDAFFLHTMDETLGTIISSALYDAEWFNTMAAQLVAHGGVEHPTDTYTWTNESLFSPPVRPTNFRGLPEMMLHAKKLLSVGLARMQRDADMARWWRYHCNGDDQSLLGITVWRQAVVRVLEGYAKYFHTILQLGLEVSSPSLRRTFHAVSHDERLRGVDPLLLVATSITASTSLREVESILLLEREAVTEALVLQLKAIRRRTSSRLITPSLFQHFVPLWYDVAEYAYQGPLDGKFWNMIRPSVACSSVVRLCELPDGCRMLCNGEYLLFAKGNMRETQAHTHRIAAFGCDNDFEWERSVHRVFRDAQRHQQNHHDYTKTLSSNKIGWLTVFDCTLPLQPNLPRSFAPPKILTEDGIGFGFSSLCLDAATKRETFSLGPRDLKRLLVESERKSSMINHSIMTSFGEMLRYSVDSDTLANDDELRAAPSTFDALSWLKLDVEGYEHAFLPSWARGELYNIAKTTSHAVAPGARDLIDFDRAASDYFSVSLLSLELHRMGHASAMAGDWQGALRTHYTMLYMYSLGFVMVASEKNPFGECCHEQAWVHYRHFTRSETWLHVR